MAEANLRSISWQGRESELDDLGAAIHEAGAPISRS
jgi:hypothetical protein